MIGKRTGQGTISRRCMNTVAWLMLWVIAAPLPSKASEFVIHPGAPNEVVFFSSTTTEKFQGKTDRLQGRIIVDPAALGDSARVHVEVDLASLDTGVKKRDQHMRENHLETAKYPLAVFDGATLDHTPGLALTPGQSVEFDSEGTFTLHGVSRRLRVHVVATFRPDQDGGSIEFSTEFPVTLGDFAITAPHFMFVKMSETQRVRVHGFASMSPGAASYSAH